LVGQVRNAFLDTIEKEAERLGLTNVQLLMLCGIAKGYGTTPKELARSIPYDPGALTRQLDVLEEKELIGRSRCTEDRRSVNLCLTPKGMEAYEKTMPAFVETENRLMRGFTDADVRQLEQLLRRMLANA
jgi:DNA-binding MarR family transcriptional regulator